MNPWSRGICRSKWAGVEHGLLGIDRSNIVALPRWIGAWLKREGRRRFISEGAQTATSTSSQLAPLKTSSNVAAGSNRGTASSKFACVSSDFRELSYEILVVLWTGPHCLSLTLPFTAASIASAASGNVCPFPGDCCTGPAGMTNKCPRVR